jgi:hypothetical protein
MKDIFMLKPDNSCVTKTGHFYLLLTGLEISGSSSRRKLELVIN